MWEGSRAGSDDIPESRTPGTGTGTLPFAGAYREGIGGFTLYALGRLLAMAACRPQVRGAWGAGGGYETAHTFPPSYI